MHTSDHGRRAAQLRSRWAASWPALAAALLAATLLAAFVQVVRANVEVGESRKRAVAARAHAVWRCNVLRSSAERASCRVQADAGATTSAP